MGNFSAVDCIKWAIENIKAIRTEMENRDEINPCIFYVDAAEGWLQDALAALDGEHHDPD